MSYLEHDYPSNIVFMRLMSITGENSILKLLGHHKRTSYVNRNAPETIDTKRSIDNYSLENDKSPQEIVEFTEKLRKEAGIKKYRTNQVMAIDIVFSLPKHRGVNNRAFFRDAHIWVKNNVQGHLISFDVHLDESTPHAHALIFPMVNGRMQGSVVKGDKAKLSQYQRSFHADVASKYGLSKSAKLSPKSRLEYENRVLTILEFDPVRRSKVWQLVQSNIKADPASYFRHLNEKAFKADKPKNAKRKTFVEIMTSKGKGARVEKTLH